MEEKGAMDETGTDRPRGRSGKGQTEGGRHGHMRFAANLTFLWPEVPFLDRFASARRAGFDAVEVLQPYDLPAPVLRERLIGNDVVLTLMNAPGPNYTGRPRGFAAVPGGGDLFRKDFDRAARVARALGAVHLNLMTGAAEGAAARDTLIENLRWAAEAAPDLSLTLEPMNAEDLPGYFLNDVGLALEVLGAVDRPNAGLLFDLYHVQRITGDALGAWGACRGRVVHVQVAGAPGRNEPDTGDIDLAAFLARIAADGYGGWVGGEYDPAGRTEDGLGWRRLAP